MTVCPQCSSEKVTQESVLEHAVCGYCGNEFYPTTLKELADEFSNASKVQLPQFKNPLTIIEIKEKSSRLRVYLHGKQGGEYLLTVEPDHTGSLQRRKSGNERNQFGTRWTNKEPTWLTTLE